MGRWARWWNTQLKSQPNPGPRADGLPESLYTCLSRYLGLVQEVEPDDLRLVGRDLHWDRREHGAGRRSGHADRHEHVRL